jgi:ribA/ribD-fused uncharacterized protein
MSLIQKPDYCFFWESKSPLSQWYVSTFIDENKIKYYNAEQFMMYHKALLFNDNVIAQQIIRTKNPKKIKKLGRRIKNFNEELWAQYKEKIVYKGNMLKFTQNKKLEKILINTDKKVLVEASPHDNIWGIGFNANNAMLHTHNWGLNLLGKILMKVRDQLNCREHFGKHFKMLIH